MKNKQRLFTNITLWILTLTLCAIMTYGVSHAQSIPEEARRHMDRGQSALEMNNSEDALNEFQKAADLAPNWPDPYYHLGLLQNQKGLFENALENLRRYLALAPHADHEREVKQHINKIEYRVEKQKEFQSIIRIITGPGEFRWKSGDQQPTWPVKFRMNGDKMEGLVHLFVVRDSRWIPIVYDGKNFQYSFRWYHCSLSLNHGCPYQVSVKSEIISKEPLLMKSRAVWKKEFDDGAIREEEYILEWIRVP